MPAPGGAGSPVIAVFDIDGVLADASHREHHVTGTPRNWDAFFDAVGSDTVIEEGRRRLLEEAAEHEVVLLSGRPERCRAETVAWLARNGIVAPTLMLRPDSDRRPAAAFKASVILSIGKPDKIAVIIDDDDRVLARLAGMGYHTEPFPQALR